METPSTERGDGVNMYTSDATLPEDDRCARRVQYREHSQLCYPEGDDFALFDGFCAETIPREFGLGLLF
jgi:hypothetical protein